MAQDPRQMSLLRRHLLPLTGKIVTDDVLFLDRPASSH